MIDPHAPGPEYGGVLSFGGYAAVGSAAGAAPGTMYFAFGRAFMGYWQGGRADDLVRGSAHGHPAEPGRPGAGTRRRVAEPTA